MTLLIKQITQIKCFILPATSILMYQIEFIVKEKQNFLNLLCKKKMIPKINKPTRVTRKTATAIDHNNKQNCFNDNCNF